MRINTIWADGFGMLAGEVLHLAPRMTLVHGGNEAGKSTWHAALYAGLCGRKRGRGRPTPDEERLRTLYTPWSGAAWKTRVQVRLEDGRVVEIQNDLGGLVACKAVQMPTGEDLSGDLQFDGTPDGSLLLGMNRRTFLATACVRQAQLMAVGEDAAALREHLQAAAATAGSDATVATALQRIEEARRMRVGLPPRRVRLVEAEARQQEAQTNLMAARAAHAEFVGLHAEAERLTLAACEAETRLGAARAAAASERARAARERADRAANLASQFPDGAPLEPTADEPLAQMVAAALAAWDGRPAEASADAHAIALTELRRELDAVPEAPSGDLAPAPEVRAAFDNWRDAVRRVERQTLERPPAPEQLDPRWLEEGEDGLDRLATELAPAPAPSHDPALAAQLTAARARVKRAQRPRPRITLLGMGALLVLVGLGLLVVQPIVAGAVAVLGLAAAFLGRPRVDSAEHAAALTHLHDLERGHDRDAVRWEEREHARQAAVERVRSLGLDPLAAAVQSAAASVRVVRTMRRDLGAWESRAATLRQDVASAEAAARAAFATRGIGGDGSAPDSLWGTYEQRCRERRAQAAGAARRPDLLRQIEAAERLLEAAGEAQARRAEASRGLRDAAAGLGVIVDMTAEEPDLAQATAARAWLTARAAALPGRVTAQQAWMAYQGILDGATVDDLVATAERLDGEAAALRAAVGEQTLDAAACDEATLEGEASSARSAAARARGSAEERARSVPSVAEAEEALAVAAAEVAKIKDFDEVLDETQRFLKLAEKTVNSDVARVLLPTLQRWLPTVTGGRYAEATVNPDNLAVQVRDDTSTFREVRHLSHGTAEQVYLLLRLALAQHLTTAAGEVCPLILDDVTVHCDSQRKVAVLDTLLAVSAERQIVLFSQEREVLAWAVAHLTGPEHAIRHLAAPAAVAV